MTIEPLVIRGAVQPYDWGRVDGLTTWGAVADGRPQAEMWFGGHPAAQSTKRDRPDVTLAGEWDSPTTPLLVKFLAAATPLSLQVHPRAGVIRDWGPDPEGLLADDGEKNEMLLAVEPFLCLADWKQPPAATKLLGAVGAPDEVVDAVSAGQMETAVRLLLTEHPVVRSGQQWVEAAAGVGADEAGLAVLAAVTARFPDDVGVAVAALLQPVQLHPGDAVYVPAGVPHAYVEGLGIEVMNSSDNVLRLGLTSKVVAVQRALDCLDAQQSAVVVRANASGQYSVAGAPFDVTLAREQAIRSESGQYRLVLIVEGDGIVTIADERFVLGVGDALAVPATAADVDVSTTGLAAVARARQ